MPLRHQRWRWGPLLWMLLGLFGRAALAQADVIPLRVIDGHLLVPAVLTNAEGESNEVMLEVMLERPETLVLHADQKEWLGKAESVGLLLGAEFRAPLQANEVSEESRQAREAMQNTLTRLHGHGLDERPVKGSLGVGFLRRFHVVLDVPAAQITLTGPADVSPGSAQIVRRFELSNGLAWLPVTVGSSEPGRLLVGTGNYDTLVSAPFARAKGKPAGDIGSVLVGAIGEKGTLDFTKDVALRPRFLADDDDTGNDDATLVMGSGLLEVFRVEIDWARSTIGFSRLHEPMFPAEDFEFFKAESSGKPESLIGFLQQHPKHRLSAEGAAELMQWRVDAGAIDDELMEALQWIADTAPPDRRMESCVAYVRTFASMPGREKLVRRAGDVALKYARNAVTVQDTYRLHNLLGEVLMEQGELTEAWKHFLSAAFVPLDDSVDRQHNLTVNLNLARVYEKQGRQVRAYARYKKALGLMRLKGQDSPSLLDLESHATDDAALTTAQRQQVEAIRRWHAEIDSAMKRLRPMIPADSLSLLDDGVS